MNDARDELDEPQFLVDGMLWNLKDMNQTSQKIGQMTIESLRSMCRDYDFRLRKMGSELAMQRAKYVAQEQNRERMTKHIRRQEGIIWIMVFLIIALVGVVLWA